MEIYVLHNENSQGYIYPALALSRGLNNYTSPFSQSLGFALCWGSITLRLHHGSHSQFLAQIFQGLIWPENRASLLPQVLMKTGGWLSLASVIIRHSLHEPISEPWNGISWLITLGHMALLQTDVGPGLPKPHGLKGEWVLSSQGSLTTVWKDEASKSKNRTRIWSFYLVLCPLHFCLLEFGMWQYFLGWDIIKCPWAL